MANDRATVDPALVGVLYDFPQVDGGASFEEALTLGLEEAATVRELDRPVELVAVHGRGLPAGSAHAMEQAFTDLVERGVLAIVGPSISDNALVVVPLADRSQVPCINYTGGEHTRSEWMFHYQVGSLAEEPLILAEHLARSGTRTVVMAHDHSLVGAGYADSFTDACDRHGIQLVGRAAVSPVAEDLGDVVARLRRAEPDCLAYLGLGVAARALALALQEARWEVTVVANSSLMFGYARREWRSGWEGWHYTDTLSDENEQRRALRGRSPRTAAGPVGVAGYDIGRLLGHGLAGAPHLTRQGVHDGLERVKRLPASSGLPGTVMGFGPQDHAALKGHYLVLRTWQHGKSVEVGAH